MNRPGDDYDIEVHGISHEVLYDILSNFGNAYSKGAFFGIYAIKGYNIDFALPRSEKAYGNGHKDFEIFTDPNLSVYDSAIRRDFTINSLYENVLTHEITDCFGGIEDIRKNIIRHVNSVSFSEDPLRVLRAAQFSARFNFEIAEETISLCKSIDLNHLSKERIEEELKKALLKSNTPSKFFCNLYKMDAMDIWFPEIKSLIGIKQNPEFHPEGDAFIHTMAVLDNAARLRDQSDSPYSFMLSALCHDLGKSITTEVGKDGKIHSYGHEKAGIQIAQSFINRITDNKNIKKYVTNMVSMHMEPNMCASFCSSVKKTNHMFDKSVCPQDLILLSECDALSSCDRNSYSFKREYLQDRLKTYREYMLRPYVTGKDLVDAQIVQDERFHDALNYAHKLRLAGINKVDALKQTLSYINKIK